MTTKILCNLKKQVFPQVHVFYFLLLLLSIFYVNYLQERYILHQHLCRILIFYMSYKTQNIDKYKNKKVIAFAGIGNPISFFDILDNNHINVVEKFNFPDHYNYSDKELQNLIDKAKSKNAILLTTEKDFLRIKKNFSEKINFLKIFVDINNKDEFIKYIKSII